MPDISPSANNLQLHDKGKTVLIIGGLAVGLFVAMLRMFRSDDECSGLVYTVKSSEIFWMGLGSVVDVALASEAEGCGFDPRTGRQVPTTACGSPN